MRLPPIAEVLGYVGGALALAAMIALLTTFWSMLGIAGHVGIGVALAIAGIAGGYVLGRAHGESARRLSQFLLFAGVAGVGVAAGFAVRDTLFAGTFSQEAAAEWGWFAGTSGIALSGGIVWWRARTLMQHLAFGGGVAAAALSVLPLIPIDGPDWGVGATLVGVSLAWGALSLRGRLEPNAVGRALAALGVFGGFQMMVPGVDGALMWALWLGALSCAALIWAGSHLDDLVVLGVGTIGLMFFSGQLVFEYIGFGVGTAVALIALGFAILGVGIRSTLRMTAESARSRRIASEVAGYLGIALAMGGAGILFGEAWDLLGAVGRIAVPLAGTVVAYGGAWLLRAADSPTARRLAQSLLAIGVLATGVTAAMVVRPFAPESRFGENVGNGEMPPVQWPMWAGMGAASVAGGLTWLKNKGSITLIAFIGALMMLVVNALNQTVGVVDQWVWGIPMVSLGMTCVVLGVMERMLPVRTALAMGCTVMFMGLQFLVRGDMGEFYLGGGLLGIAVGVAGIVASIYLKRGILLGFGALYTVAFTMTLVMELFGGRAGAPILLLAMGVLLIALAVVTAVAAPRIRRAPEPRVSTPHEVPPLAHE